MYKDKIKRGNKNKGYYYYRKKENYIYIQKQSVLEDYRNDQFPKK